MKYKWRYGRSSVVVVVVVHAENWNGDVGRGGKELKIYARHSVSDLERPVTEWRQPAVSIWAKYTQKYHPPWLAPNVYARSRKPITRHTCDRRTLVAVFVPSMAKRIWQKGRRRFDWVPRDESKLVEARKRYLLRSDWQTQPNVSAPGLPLRVSVCGMRRGAEPSFIKGSNGKKILDALINCTCDPTIWKSRLLPRQST